ncbi:MAG: hypothetical protein E7521_06420 [Ruminococcaceae bacterium]|nr:hypothetical protein [Oscillospiraceae bacterium]
MSDLFKIGDTVVYGAQGICKIDCIETKQIGRQKQDYYVLKPIFNQNTSVFVPVDNEVLTAKMLSALTKAQINDLAKKVTNIEIIKANDENQKREFYKSILSSGNREQLISLIKTVRLERDTRREAGKKLNISDEQTLRKAETLLYNEIAFVCGVEPDEAKNIINI